MTESKSCPKCGSIVPSGAPSGICPKCLMQAGVESAGESHNSDMGSTFAATAPHSNAFVPPEPASIAPFFPQLELIELLGQGGMGAVYKARQTKLDRFVALKVIRPDLSADAAFAERFNREAKVLARLIHPNIVAVHDFGEVNTSPQGESDTSARTMYYFVMEYVDGTNLRQLADNRQTNGVGISAKEISTEVATSSAKSTRVSELPAKTQATLVLWSFAAVYGYLLTANGFRKLGEGSTIKPWGDLIAFFSWIVVWLVVGYFIRRPSRRKA